MRTRKKIAMALVVIFALACTFVFVERFELAAWYLEGNKVAQEALILQMLAYSRPIIQNEFKMTLLEKIFSALAGHRSQRERQADALKDVRSFCAQSFADHRLKFVNVHGLSSMGGFNIRGFDLALAWGSGKTVEVFAAFNVNFWKRSAGTMTLNENCGFVTALRLYVEKRAKEN
jgi:hypothetical protein